MIWYTGIVEWGLNINAREAIEEDMKSARKCFVLFCFPTVCGPGFINYSDCLSAQFPITLSPGFLWNFLLIFPSSFYSWSFPVHLLGTSPDPGVHQTMDMSRRMKWKMKRMESQHSEILPSGGGDKHINTWAHHLISTVCLPLPSPVSKRY